jgi:hypothetical protein
VTYQRTIDRRHPGCLIFLLDQSGSMAEPIGGQSSVSKADALADIINDLLHAIVRRCVKDPDGPPRHYYDLGIIGYGETAKSGFGGDLSGRHLASVEEVANATLRIEEHDGVVAPVWFSPVAASRTAMCAAFDLAGQVASGWIGAHQDSFPPIVLNVSDGKATDGDPAEWAQRLRGLRTLDGELLLFNINLSSGVRQPLAFPSSAQDLPDDYSRQMFALSSPLPDFMRRHAKERGMPADVGARGFVCNADISTVIQALAVGTTLEQIGEY